MLQGFGLAGTYTRVTALKFFEDSTEIAMKQPVARPQRFVGFPSVALKDN